MKIPTALSPAWSREITMELLYPVTQWRVSESWFPDSCHISYNWNNNYKSAPWAVLFHRGHIFSLANTWRYFVGTVGWYIVTDVTVWKLNPDAVYTVIVYVHGWRGKVFNNHLLLSCVWLLEKSRSPDVTRDNHQKSSVVLRPSQLFI